MIKVEDYNGRIINLDMTDEGFEELVDRKFEEMKEQIVKPRWRQKHLNSLTLSREEAIFNTIMSYDLNNPSITIATYWR